MAQCKDVKKCHKSQKWKTWKCMVGKLLGNWGKIEIRDCLSNGAD